MGKKFLPATAPRLKRRGIQEWGKTPLRLPVCESVGVGMDDVTIYLKTGPVPAEWSAVIQPTHEERKLWIVFQNVAEEERTYSIYRRMKLIMACYSWNDAPIWKNWRRFQSYRGDGCYRHADPTKTSTGFTPGAIFEINSPDVVCPEHCATRWKRVTPSRNSVLSEAGESSESLSYVWI